MNILVTGAAGYIGSVVTECLIREGHRVVALDNLQKGHRRAVDPGAHFIQADLNDREKLGVIFRAHQIDGVVHLAADSLVGESIELPGKYFRNNVVNGLNLLDVMVENGVKNIVFSSSAALYGEPEAVPITEAAVIAPVNPYGESKAIFERMLKWYAVAHGINSISLRYFNAAGATEKYGEHHDPETHLIPNIFKVAQGKLPRLSIFGTDYPTEDGTCIRDYVHVLDIADAHLRALENIENAGARAYNLGSETGGSVLQVVKTTEEVIGSSIPVNYESRRAGDPPVLVASSGLAKRELSWTPRHPELSDIISSAWRWQKKFPDGYPE